LVSDALAQELAEAAQAEEDASYVRADEFVELVKRWPTYRGKKIGSDDIRAWFERVGSHKEPRLLFTILRGLRFFSEIEIREKLKVAYSILRPKLPQFVVKKRSDRRTDVIVTYVDGEGKSGQYYAGRFAEENQIPATSILSTARFTTLLKAYQEKYGAISAVVVVDDIIAPGGSLSKKLRSFVQENEATLKELKAPVIAIALTSTPIGEKRFERLWMNLGGWILSFAPAKCSWMSFLRSKEEIHCGRVLTISAGHTHFAATSELIYIATHHLDLEIKLCSSRFQKRALTIPCRSYILRRGRKPRESGVRCFLGLRTRPRVPSQHPVSRGLHAHVTAHRHLHRR
jgi:hypothetical protein